MTSADDLSTVQLHVTDAILGAIIALEAQGFQMPEILAVAHAEIVSVIAELYGGRIAAESCRTAAELFAPHPSLTEALYSAEPVAGRA